MFYEIYQFFLKVDKKIYLCIVISRLVFRELRFCEVSFMEAKRLFPINMKPTALNENVPQAE